MNTFWFALWFFLPAGLANASPLFLNKIPFINRWNTPLDFGKTFRGKRIFGDNKTWRGLVGGMIVATLVVAVQTYVYSRSRSVRIFCWPVIYRGTFASLIGPLLGFGALAGDAVGSFLKRQGGVKPGESWFPFDQIDYIIGGLLAARLVVWLELKQYLMIFAVWFCLHLISSYIGYLFKLKDRPI